MSQGGKSHRGNNSGKRSPSRSLGIIDEANDSFLDQFGEDELEEEERQFTREDVFENEMSMVDSAAPGTSVFIDLEAEERAFVSGSQQYLDAVETIKQLKQRLIRRTAIIDEIRKYYLRDVVTVKHIIKDVLTSHERKQVFQAYDENLPSINLKEALKLHAPVKCELQVAKCGECGGHLEIIMKDSDEVDMLKKTIIDCKDRESRFRIKLATLDAQIENTMREKAEASKSHAEEKRFLYAEMKKVKAEVEKVQTEMSAVNKANKRALAENDQLRAQLSTLQQASTQLAAGTMEIESLRTEVNDLTSALKSARYAEKNAQRELAEKTTEAAELAVRCEEQAQVIKSLRRERDEAHQETVTLKASQAEATGKLSESVETARVQAEKIAELESVLEETKSEHDRLMSIFNSSEGSMKHHLLDAEEASVELKTTNKRLQREVERLKRSLDKAQEQKLVLEHDLAVAHHETKQREEELHSLQNFIENKVGKSTETLSSIKMEARNRLGDGPTMSARVASAKQNLQLEQQAKLAKAAAAVVAGAGGSGDGATVVHAPHIDTDHHSDEEDGELGNFDQDHDHDEVTDASESGTKASKSKRRMKKAKNVLSVTPKKSKARRGSFGDKTGLKSIASAATMATDRATAASPVPSTTSTTASVATKDTTKPSPSKTKAPKKTTKKAKRQSFDPEEGPTPGGSNDAADAEGAHVDAEGHHSDEEHGDHDHADGVAAVEEDDHHDQDDHHDDEHHDDHHDEHHDEDEEGGDADETGEHATTSPTKRKRAPKAAKPPKVPKRPKSRQDVSSSAENTPASTPIKTKRSAANVKKTPSKVDKEDKAEKHEKAAHEKPTRAKPKRRKSLEGGDAIASAASGSMDASESRPPSRSDAGDSRPVSRGDAAGSRPDSRASFGESRPTTRGSDGGGDFDGDLQEGEVEHEIAGDVEGEDEPIKDSARAALPSGRTEEAGSDGEHAEEGEEEQDEHAQEHADADHADGHDDGAEEGEAEGEEGDVVEGEAESEHGAVEGSEAGSMPPSSRRSKDTTPRSNPSTGRRPGSRGDGEGERATSRESKRTRTPDQSKKLTSKDIKREAMEKASPKHQKQIKTVTPTLEGAKKDRRSKAPLPKQRAPLATVVSKPSSAGSAHSEASEPLEEEDADEAEGGEEDVAEEDAVEESAEATADNSGENSEEGEEDGDEGEEEEEEEEEEEVVVVVQKETKSKAPKEKSGKPAPKKEEKPKEAAKATKSAPKPAPAEAAPKKTVPKVEVVKRQPSQKGSAITTSTTSAAVPEETPAVASALPLPKRRRSIPRNFSFSAHSMLDLLGEAQTPTREGAASPVKRVPAAAAPLAAVTQAAAATKGTESPKPAGAGAGAGAGAETKGSPERLARLEEEFAAGLHRVPDPPSIHDEDDLRDRAHVKLVPIIPIEVKKYIVEDPNVPKPKKKQFTIPTEEEPVELDPLPDGHTPLEAQLRRELTKVMLQAKGMTPNQMHRSLNCTAMVLHDLCRALNTSLESSWQSLKASRTALDLHYVMKHVISGMAPCAEAKSTSVELAEACKKILPIAGLSMTGPTVTNKWQEELKLETSLMTNLVPKVDPSTGKIASKSADEHFSIKTAAPGALADKAAVITRAAVEMAQYATDSSKLVTDKITPILKDWAKAKNAFYEMDAKIAAEKDKVRKVLETRIGDLTKEKLMLGKELGKAEERVKALEGTERELETTKFTLKKTVAEVQSKVEEIEGLERTIQELNDEVYTRKTKESELNERIVQLIQQGATLEREKAVLNQVVAQGIDDLKANKEVLKEVSEERDHFQAQYERMLSQEDSRLNKLVHVQMQCEPAVQDLAIQTEFVAPPMNLRTMVAAKNARGNKAPLIMSQSLEITPSDPSVLTSVMVDTVRSTFSPLSAAGTIKVAHSSGAATGVFASDAHALVPSLAPLQFISPPSSQQGATRNPGGLSARSTMSIETGVQGTERSSSPTHSMQVRSRSREDTSAGLQRGLSREESFELHASDFLSAAPINYDLSSHRLRSAEINELARSLGDDSSVGSSKAQGSRITKKKAVRVPQQPSVASSGHYQYVHTDDKIPDWGSVHGPVGATRVDPHVVLGISGVNSIGGHTAKVYGMRGEFGANSNHGTSTSISTSTLAAAGSALLRPSHGASLTAKVPSGRGLEIEVGLPEVKVQSYNVPTHKPNVFAGAGVTVRPQAGGSDVHYVQSGPNSRGSHNSIGLGATSPEGPHLMLDSPSLGGSSGYSGYSFERDRRDPLKVAGELPASQELVNGIVYNHRANATGVSRPLLTDGAGMLHSASQGSVGPSQQGSKGGGFKGNKKPGMHLGGGDGSNGGAVSGMSEEILKRLRKELLSR